MPYYEDLEAEDRSRSRIGRTITEADNVWFTALTMNTTEIYFNAVYTTTTPWESPSWGHALGGERRAGGPRVSFTSGLGGSSP